MDHFYDVCRKLAPVARAIRCPCENRDGCLGSKPVKRIGSHSGHAGWPSGGGGSCLRAIEHPRCYVEKDSVGRSSEGKSGAKLSVTGFARLTTDPSGP